MIDNVEGVRQYSYANLMVMKCIGLNPYKMVEMWKNYRPNIPVEFQNNELYAKPDKKVLAMVKDEKSYRSEVRAKLKAEKAAGMKEIVERIAFDTGDGEKVEVEVFKEIQYYSHVIHLVSKVTGILPEGTNPLQLVADTFPAGTLSGAPKYRAMELIDQLENTSRKFYGGAIGFLGFNGDFNHAILIRSFVSQNNRLRFQAGAGVVAKSFIQSELQEVTNKLEALRVALKAAEGI